MNVWLPINITNIDREPGCWIRLSVSSFLFKSNVCSFPFHWKVTHAIRNRKQRHDTGKCVSEMPRRQWRVRYHLVTIYGHDSICHLIPLALSFKHTTRHFFYHLNFLSNQARNIPDASIEFLISMTFNPQDFIYRCNVLSLSLFNKLFHICWFQYKQFHFVPFTWLLCIFLIYRKQMG